MDELRVSGLCVRETHTGENDKLITLITPEYGRISVSGKGVKSLKSKNMAACQSFCLSNFLLRRTKRYYYIVESELIEPFWGLRSDLDKLALAAYVCDVACDVSVEGMADEEMFRLTLNTLYAIANKSSIPLPVIKGAFEFKCACVSGFMPDLTSCGRCGKRIVGDAYLDIMNGRLLCRDCRPLAEKEEELLQDNGSARLYFSIDIAVVEALRYIAESDVRRFLSFLLPPDEIYLFRDICEAYLINHLEHGFYTLDFYKSILI